jgi:hypothetical protein
MFNSVNIFFSQKVSITSVWILFLQFFKFWLELLFEKVRPVCTDSLRPGLSLKPESGFKWYAYQKT